MSNRASKYAICLLAAVAVASTLLAYFFFTRALDYYAREQAVRLDPTSGRVMSEKKLPERTPGAPLIVFFGDSRIEQWSELPSPANADVANRGRGGDTSAQALLRLPRDVLPLKPDLVVMQIGINDLKVIGVMPEHSESITRGCVENIRKIATRLDAAQIEVLWVPILPVGPVPLTRTPIWSDKTLTAIQTVNETLVTLAESPAHLADISSLQSEGRMKPAFALDEFHLTQDGYAAWEAALSANFSQLLTPNK